MLVNLLHWFAQCEASTINALTIFEFQLTDLIVFFTVYIDAVAHKSEWNLNYVPRRPIADVDVHVMTSRQNFARQATATCPHNVLHRQCSSVSLGLRSSPGFTLERIGTLG